MRIGDADGCCSDTARGPVRAAEFFAGMGLVRAGLERCGISTVFANDIDETKAQLYRSNWGDDALVVDDIRNLSGDQVPDVELATASFPCVDLSLAGSRAGLAGEHSGLIHHFVRVLDEMKHRAPPAVLVENVPGFRSANGGQDFADVIGLLTDVGYSVSDITVDAAAFVAQSRPRVFLLASQSVESPIPQPPPKREDLRLADLVNDDDSWWIGAKRTNFFGSLSDVQRAKLSRSVESQTLSWHGAYRRTRQGSAVWEIRGDEIAGALRTTRGGSSRQAVVRAGQGAAQVRWMNITEYARLQGADRMQYDSVTERQAMFALGDAVCVPVIEWIAQNWLVGALA